MQRCIIEVRIDGVHWNPPPASSTVSLGIGGVRVTTREQNTYSWRQLVAMQSLSCLFSSHQEGRSRAFGCNGSAKRAFLRHRNHKNTSRLISNVLTGYLQNKVSKRSENDQMIVVTSIPQLKLF